MLNYQLQQQSLVKLLVSLLLCALPLLLLFPAWLALLFIVVSTWRIFVFKRNLSLPSTTIKASLLVLGLVAIALSFSRLLSLEVFVCFFLVALFLKLLELQWRKDALLVVHLIFVVLACNFLFYQSFLLSLYAFVCVFVVLWFWMGLFQTRKTNIKRQLTNLAFVFAVVLPLLLLLFVSIPRLGPLWKMPGQGQTASTGFSDSMAPGDFSKLIRSNETAFRVNFEGELPRPEQRYWRAMVLDKFDGRRWTQALKWQAWSYKEDTGLGPKQSWQLRYDSNSLLSYKVLVEAHQQPWLFSLMAPVSARASSLSLSFTDNATIKNRYKLGTRSEYQVSSAMRYTYSAQSLSPEFKRRNLLLPSNNSRALAYAKELRKGVGLGSEADERLIEKVLAQYHASFFYTLEPPILGSNTVDEFLFDSKQGFCEHFSSSFVFLLRAAGIPARVVVGYQGGQWNQAASYLLVKQSDAHAWAEAWIEGKGWLRFDPTAAVAPSRIERSLSEALSPEEAQALLGLRASVPMLQWLSLRLDEINYRWQSLVVNFDGASQHALLSRLLGHVTSWRMLLLFLGGFACILLLYFSLLWLSRPTKTLTARDRAFYQLLMRLNKAGYHREKHETAMHFVKRVANLEPAWRLSLFSIARQYETLLYNKKGQADGQAEKAFVLACKHWRAIKS